MCTYVSLEQVEQVARCGSHDRTTVHDVDQITPEYVRGLVWNHCYGRWERRWMARAMTPAYANGCRWVLEAGHTAPSTTAPRRKAAYRPADAPPSAWAKSPQLGKPQSTRRAEP